MTRPETLLLLALAAGPALRPTEARAQAQGTYPALLVCDAAGGGVREQARFSLVIDGDGRATYRLRLGTAPAETGSGRLAGRTLTLSGAAPGAYRSRYAGDITGRGGLLSGTHAAPAASRACQIVLGDG